GEPHRCIYVCRCADDPGQAAGGCRCQTEFVYSSSLLRCGPPMPSRNRTRADPNWWYEISGPREPRATPCESTARIASVPFPDGLASKTQYRARSCVASRGDAINNRHCVCEDGLRGSYACGHTPRLAKKESQASRPGFVFCDIRGSKDNFSSRRTLCRRVPRCR